MLSMCLMGGDMQLRDASRTPTFLALDAKWIAFVAPSVFFLNAWTIAYDVMVILLFVVLRIKGMEISYAYRRLRSALRGGTVESRPWWFLKKWRNR